MKTCNNLKCLGPNPQPLENFFRDKGNKTDGRYSICKACKQAKTMEWREKNRDKYNAYMRSKSEKYYPIGRLRRYKLTPEQHSQMLKEQNHVCKLCEKPPKGSRPLVVDHCRLTGAVRGLLCYGCNRLIVILDNHPLHKKAEEYLKAA